MIPSIVFSDMDGTFLASDKTIPSANLAVLDELVRRDIPFAPCSGRAGSGFVREVIEHPATRYAVCSNGASIYRVKHDGGAARLVALREVTFPKDAAVRLFEALRGREMQFDVFADGRAWVNAERFRTIGEYGIAPKMLAYIRSNRQSVELEVPEIVARANRVERLHLCFKDDETRDAMMAAVDAIDGICYLAPESEHIEVCVEGANKGSALAWLCEHEGLDLASSVAFGDGGNDVELLRAAGIGFAMAGALEVCRAAADRVCAGNDEGGVGSAIRELLDEM